MRGQRNTNIRACKFQGAAEGEGVSHAALPRLLGDGLSCAREKKSALCPAHHKPKPRGGKNPAVPSEGTVHGGTK